MAEGSGCWIKMGDGEAPVVGEFKYLGSMLSKNFDDSVTIMARIRVRLARIAFTKLRVWSRSSESHPS